MVEGTVMGWRAWDAYDTEAHERWRALPWHRRYGWRRVAILALIVGLIAVIFWAKAVRAEDLTGVPYIVDGDTVHINGVKLRLEGIDAPEMGQFCLDDKSQRAECGKGVRDRLIEKSAGRPWTCRVSGQDIYHRSLASCHVGGEDVQRWMVRSGFALAFKRYSHAYDADETAAREAHAGLWSGAFIAPWDWRSRNKSTEILGAVSVPVGAQAVLLKPESTSAPTAVTSVTPTVHTSSKKSHGHCQNPSDRAANGSRCGKRAASVRSKNQ